MGDAIIAVISMLGFSVGFPLMWIGVTWFIGFAGGWRSLAKEFPHEGPAPQSSSGLRTLSIGLLGRYNHVARMALTPQAVVFSTMILFKMGHPPISIPGGALRFQGTKMFGGYCFTIVRKNGSTQQINVYGDGGRALKQWLEAGGPRPAA